MIRTTIGQLIGILLLSGFCNQAFAIVVEVDYQIQLTGHSGNSHLNWVDPSVIPTGFYDDATKAQTIMDSTYSLSVRLNTDLPAQRTNLVNNSVYDYPDNSNFDYHYVELISHDMGIITPDCATTGYIYCHNVAQIPAYTWNARSLSVGAYINIYDGITESWEHLEVGDVMRAYITDRLALAEYSYPNSQTYSIYPEDTYIGNATVVNVSIISSVPEPATLALLSLGLIGIGYRRQQAD